MLSGCLIRVRKREWLDACETKRSSREEEEMRLSMWRKESKAPYGPYIVQALCDRPHVLYRYKTDNSSCA